MSNALYHFIESNYYLSLVPVSIVHEVNLLSRLQANIKHIVVGIKKLFLSLTLVWMLSSLVEVISPSQLCNSDLFFLWLFQMANKPIESILGVLLDLLEFLFVQEG